MKGVYYVMEQHPVGWKHFYGPFNKKDAYARAMELVKDFPNRTYEIVR